MAKKQIKKARRATSRKTTAAVKKARQGKAAKLKLPKQLVNPVADTETANPAGQEAAQLLSRFSELKTLPRSTSDVPC